MNIAVIITGQIRTTCLTKWFHKCQFIENENCDIFLSIDSNNETQLLYKNSTDKTKDEEVQNLIAFYKPKEYFIGNSSDDDIIYNDYKCLVNKPLKFYDTSNENDQTTTEINEYLIGQKETFMKDTINLKNVSYNNGKLNKGCLTESSIKGLFRQFYFVKKGYELLQKHKTKFNKQYDIVIRLRFDHILFTDTFLKQSFQNFEIQDNTILFSQKNIELSKTMTENDLHYDSIYKNTINVMGAGVYKKYIYVNDYFWTHGDDLIEKIMTFYDALFGIISFTLDNFFPIYGAGIEHYFAIFLKNESIQLRQSKMVKCNIIRQINKI